MKTSLESSHFLYIISVGSDKVGFIWLSKMQFFHLLSMLYCVLYTYFLTSVKWDKKGKMGKWGRSKVLLFTCMYLSYKGYVDATLVDTRLIQQQNENVIWRRESAQKGLNSTSGTQFAALTLVNPVVRFARAVVNWRLRLFAKSADSCVETITISNEAFVCVWGPSEGFRWRAKLRPTDLDSGSSNIR